MPYYTVYKVTNKINNMIYIGVHVTKNIKDNYIGSGTNIRKAIKEFGRHNFMKEILYVFDNKEDMLNKEKELVDDIFIARPDTYNIILGGSTYLTTNCLSVRDKHGKIFMVHQTDERYKSGELVSITKGKICVKDENGKTYQVKIDDERYLSGVLKPMFVGLTVVVVAPGYQLVHLKLNNYDNNRMYRSSR